VDLLQILVEALRLPIPFLVLRKRFDGDPVVIPGEHLPACLLVELGLEPLHEQTRDPWELFGWSPQGGSLDAFEDDVPLLLSGNLGEPLGDRGQDRSSPYDLGEVDVGVVLLGDVAVSRDGQQPVHRVPPLRDKQRDVPLDVVDVHGLQGGSPRPEMPLKLADRRDG